jgi:hypothetical protein
MPSKKYYDPITRSDLAIKASTILYITRTDEGYKIQGISSGIESLRYNPHLTLPSVYAIATHDRASQNATQYWRIENPVQFLNNVSERLQVQRVFPQGKLTETTFSLEDIKQYTGIDPTEITPSLFSPEANSESVSIWENDRLTEERFNEMIAEYFIECLTPDNYEAIQSAVDALTTYGRNLDTPEHIEALSLLNIPPDIQSEFIHALTTGEFAFNHEAHSRIESFFALSSQFPTHASRYHVQVNLQVLIDENYPRPFQSSTLSILADLGTAINDSDALGDTSIIEAQMDQSLFEFVREEFISKITAGNLETITASWQAYQETSRLTPQQQINFSLLNISPDSIEQFKANLELNNPHVFEIPVLKAYYTRSIFGRLTLSGPQTHLERLGEFVFFNAILDRKRRELIVDNDPRADSDARTLIP